MRVIFEFVVTLILAMVARALLRSLMKGFQNASNAGYTQASNQPQTPPTPQPARERVNVAGELHKDPVCGMYVAESTRYQRRSGRETFYYCSEECKEKHAVAAH